MQAPDAQNSLRDLTGIVALVHCLVVLEATRAAATAGPGPEALAECCFRAMRDGLDARLFFEGRQRPLPELVLATLASVAPIAEWLGCVAELEEVRRVLLEGNGAPRQRAAYAAGGLPGVVSMLHRETHGEPDVAESLSGAEERSHAIA